MSECHTHHTFCSFILFILTHFHSFCSFSHICPSHISHHLTNRAWHAQPESQHRGQPDVAPCAAGQCSGGAEARVCGASCGRAGKTGGRHTTGGLLVLLLSLCVLCLCVVCVGVRTGGGCCGVCLRHGVCMAKCSASRQSVGAIWSVADAPPASNWVAVGGRLLVSWLAKDMHTHTHTHWC